MTVLASSDAELSNFPFFDEEFGVDRLQACSWFYNS